MIIWGLSSTLHTGDLNSRNVSVEWCHSQWDASFWNWDALMCIWACMAIWTLCWWWTYWILCTMRGAAVHCCYCCWPLDIQSHQATLCTCCQPQHWSCPAPSVYRMLPCYWWCGFQLTVKCLLDFTGISHELEHRHWLWREGTFLEEVYAMSGFSRLWQQAESVTLLQDKPQ